MEQLILLRHAKAEPEQLFPDRDRPLTPRGRDAALQAGRRLAALNVQPNVALVSTARRTRETWEQVQPSLPRLEAKFVDALYMASPETLWREAQAATTGSCLVIGHNPGLHELAQHLVAQSYDESAQARMLRERFPTAALAIFDLSGDTLAAAGPRLLAVHMD